MHCVGTWRKFWPPSSGGLFVPDHPHAILLHCTLLSAQLHLCVRSALSTVVKKSVLRVGHRYTANIFPLFFSLFIFSLFFPHFVHSFFFSLALLFFFFLFPLFFFLFFPLLPSLPFFSFFFFFLFFFQKSTSPARTCHLTAVQAPRRQITHPPLTPRRRSVTRADLWKCGVAIA